jgi:hypothetical protein
MRLLLARRGGPNRGLKVLTEAKALSMRPVLDWLRWK